MMSEVEACAPANYKPGQSQYSNEKIQVTSIPTRFVFQASHSGSNGTMRKFPDSEAGAARSSQNLIEISSFSTATIGLP